MAAGPNEPTLRTIAIWTSVTGITLAALVALGATATAGPERGLKTLLLVGIPWVLGLVPVVVNMPCWLQRVLWVVVVVWGAAVAWITLPGGLGFIIFPLTLIYAVLVTATVLSR